MSWLRGAWTAVREAGSAFVDDDAMTLGGALAFYTALAMSPLVVLLLWIASLLGPDMQGRLVAQLADVVGPQGGQALQAIIANAEAMPGLGNAAGIVSLATLLFSVSGVFAQLQYALNQIWDVEPAPGRAGAWAWIRKRLLSIGTFVSVGFLLVVSLALSAGIAAASQHTRDVLPGSDLVWRVATFAVSLGATAFVFALVFEVLPDVRIRWRDALVGGVVTGLLFAVGRVAIGLYLGRSSVGSAYGAAGSLVVLLLWVYYAALIVFAGAELTEVIARRSGRALEPEPHAVAIEKRRIPRARRVPA